MEKIQAFFKTTLGNSFTALTSASGINLLATPYEATKLRILSMDQKLKTGKLDRPYYSVVDCAIRTIKEEGFGTLLRGNFTKNFLPSVTYQTLTFTVFYSFKNLYPLKEQFKNPSFTQSLLVNTVFGMSSVSISLAMLQFFRKFSYIFDRFPMIEKKTHKKTSKIKTETYKRHMKNLKASQLLDGCSKPSLMGHILGKGIYFGFYESAKEFMPQTYKQKLFWQAMLGLAVSYCSQRVESRVNWIKKLMNITKFRLEANATSLDCFRYIVQNEGWMAFAKWYEPWALRNVKVKNALMLVMFGRLQDEFNKRHEKKY